MNMPLNLRDRAIDVIDTADMAAERLTRLVGSSFACWRTMESGKAQPHALTGETLADVERQLACAANYGETFMVLESEALNQRATLHAYRIRRGKWTGRYNADLTKAYPHAADKLFAVEVAVFEPVQPWRYAPGCDPVGRGNVIEAR